MNSSALQYQKGLLTIVTYRDVFQWVAKEKGLFNSDYQERSAIVQMSTSDMKAIGIEEKSTVRLTNDAGSVVVKAQSSLGCQQGYGHMPVSPYANRLTSYDGGKASLPHFKQIVAEIEPTDDEVTTLFDLFNPMECAENV